MQILFNTDKTISGEERNKDYFIALIADGLKIYNSHVTRVEVHISDENGTKDGPKDIRCVLEARIEGKQPIAVTDQQASIEQAVNGAIVKLKASLKTIIERSRNY